MVSEKKEAAWDAATLAWVWNHKEVAGDLPREVLAAVQGHGEIDMDPRLLSLDNKGQREMPQLLKRGNFQEGLFG